MCAGWNRADPARARPMRRTGTSACCTPEPLGSWTHVVPFVRDGLARQEPVMVAVAEPRLRALRSALGEDAERVVFADMADLGHNPALIIPAWRDFTDRHSGTGRPVRGIGEPIWATRRPEEIVEAQLHEALLNMAVPPDIPLWLLCPYDTAALDEQVLAEAHRSHPVIVDSGDYRGSTGYGGAVHVEELFGAAAPRPRRARSPTITFDPHRHRHIEQILRSADQAAAARRPGGETGRRGRRDRPGRRPGHRASDASGSGTSRLPWSVRSPTPAWSPTR